MKVLIAVLTTVLFTSSAWAGIYIEPYLGYEVGTIKGDADLTTAGAIDIDYKSNGTNFGAKLGYSFLLFAAGADYMSGNLHSDTSVSGQNDESFKTTDVGAFVQVSVPMICKFSATYFMSSDAKGTSTSASGNGMKFGIGFTFLPFIAINVDMININYDDADIDGDTVTTFNADRKTVMFGISLPLDF